MRNAKLFFEKKVEDGSFFELTEKGKIFDKIVYGEYSEYEQYFLALIFIIDANINKEKNYLLVKTREVFDTILGKNFTEEKIILKLEEVLKLKTSKLEDYMVKDFFFIHSFYDDQDFIINFLNSTEKEKEELRKYILKNKKDKNYICCLSKKYQNSGSVTVKTFYSEVYIFYMNLLILKNINDEKENIFYFILEHIFKLQNGDFNIKKIKNLLDKNKSLFFDTYSILANKPDEEFYKIRVFVENIIEAPKDEKKEYLDETNLEEKRKIKQTFNSLKNIAKKEQGYKCIFDGPINQCQYFTSKSTEKTYLELHHIIPREFRNEFGYSIEVLANYIALCPYCHRKIHNAKDREREMLVNNLFEIRKKRLTTVGLDLKLEELKKFYKIKE